MSNKVADELAAIRRMHRRSEADAARRRELIEAELNKDKRCEQAVRDAADHLVANVFGEREGASACACMGIDCVNLNCRAWWETFLSMSDDDLKTMVRAGLNNVDTWRG